MSSYFFLEAEKNDANESLINTLEEYAKVNQTLIYVLDRPLTDQKYSYEYSDALIILSSKRKIAIINYRSNQNQYEDFVEDVIEDIGSISDKYLYKEVIGRPRTWRESLVETQLSIDEISDINQFFEKLSLTERIDHKKIDLLISLFIGSINDVDRVKKEIPQTILDQVKQKIQLFDGDQTRFIYQTLNKKQIRIQGLSGTGKTELLLHKLKELYVNDSESKIFFTCHNKILANSLAERIPNFFNFMKVEQQIEWNKRLWCRHAWGSLKEENSGAYKYICDFYKIQFHAYSWQMPFSRVCEFAIKDIKERYGDQIPNAFTYMLIDESQDFDNSFFELCELVTEKNIYVAGDIFQNIFGEKISSTIEPDFLLSKCYRTDPKTLMFAHGLGMGLFEKTKLRWLEEKEWKDCGYQVEVKDSKYYLTREPIKRFEDLDKNFKSIRVVETTEDLSDKVIRIIREIKNDHETIQPEDISIIFLENSNNNYEFANLVEIKIQKEFGWAVNKAYESKQKQPNTLLISNKNNSKGLEFPCVICLTKEITSNQKDRSSLYTMLTRSFLQSFLIIQSSEKSDSMKEINQGLRYILTHQKMVIEEPSEKEKENIQTTFKYALQQKSVFDMMKEIFEEEQVEEKYQDEIPKILKSALEILEKPTSEAFEKSDLVMFVHDAIKTIRRLESQ